MLLAIVFLVIEGVAKVWWNSIENCAFEDSDIYENVQPSMKRQMCIESYQIQFSPSHIEPNQNFETININSFGFRGKEITFEKSENIFRIFTIGGSTMLGTGSTSDVTTIAGFLQERFDNGNLDVEVINAGVSGAWSSTEVNYIKNKLLQFNPDMFIVYDGWNDAASLESINDDKIPGKITEWSNRWKEICELGTQVGFHTIITIQPMVGTSNKTLSENEYQYYLELQQTKIPQRLELFALTLPELENSCSSTADLRNTFDNLSLPIYWDYGHMANVGNKIISQKLFELSIPIITNNYDLHSASTNKYEFSNAKIENESEEDELKDTYVLVKRSFLKNVKTPLMIHQIFIQSQEQLITHSININKNELNKNIDLEGNLSNKDLSKTYFVNTDFSHRELQNVNFFGAYLRNSDFKESNLFQANFTFANLSGSDMSGVDLQFADLRKSDLTNTNLQNSDMVSVNLLGAKLYNTNLHGANLTNVDLSVANLQSVDFQDAILKGTNFEGTDLRRVFLMNSDLSGANLQGTYISGAQIQGASVVGTDFSGSTFYNTNFSGMDLTFTNFSHAVLEGIDFSNSNLNGTNFEGVVFNNVDFTNSNLEDAVGSPFIGCKGHHLCT